MKYAWIKEQNAFSVAAMCRVLSVSKSGYYKSLSPKTSQRRQRTQRIRHDVKKIYEESRQIYGSYKIAQELQNDETMESACRNTVAKAMKDLDLKSCVSKTFRPTTTVSDSSKTPAANVLNQNFAATAPNQKWVTDITYLQVTGGWVYLAAVLDLFSRKISAGRSRKVWQHLWSATRSAGLSKHEGRTPGSCCTTAIAAASTPVTNIKRRSGP